MDLLTRIDRQIDLDPVKGAYGLQRGSVLAVIGDGHKVQAYPAAGPGHICRGLSAVRVVAVYMKIAFVGPPWPKVVLQSIQAKLGQKPTG
jgi:hypothetical protein